MNLWVSLGVAGILLLGLVRVCASVNALRARWMLRAGLVTLGGLLLLGFLLQLSSADCGLLPKLWSDSRLQGLQALLVAGVVVNLIWTSFRLRTLRRGAVVVPFAENPVAPLSVELSSAVAAPSLWSLWRPRILFPLGLWTQLPPSARALILRHEEAHALGRDLWWRALSRMALALSLLHPVLWLLHRELIRLDEFVADDWALAQTRSRKSDLVRLFLRMPLGGPGIAAVALFPGEMRARAERLLSVSSGSRWVVGRPFVALMFSLWMLSAVTASAFETKLLKAEFGPEGLELHRTEIRLSVLNPLLASAYSFVDQPICRRNP